MNSDDLLYTNTFLSSNVLSPSEIKDQTKNYGRFKNYIEKTSISDTKKYQENSDYETSLINLQKSNMKPWPIHNKKNHYPILSSSTEDLVSNRYKKEIVTKVNIDSNNRDISVYSNSNDFAIPLNKVFNNIKKIVLNDINFKNVNQPITNQNNNLAFQFADEASLLENSYDSIILPVPSSTRPIPYSSLPNAVFSNSMGYNEKCVVSSLVYQTSVIPGFYTVQTLLAEIRRATSTVLHGQNMTTDLPIVEQPYNANIKRINTPNLFSFQINPISSVVRIVNRMEEIDLLAVQTFSPYETNFAQNDIFYSYSSQTLPYQLDTTLIYFLLPMNQDTTQQYYENINCLYQCNPFPLVITDFVSNIGNIDFNLFNYTCFFDVNIYLKNGYMETEMESISYYKFIDTITLGTTSFLRFGFHLSTGNVNGMTYNTAGKTVIPCITDNLVFSKAIDKYLQSKSTVYLYETVPQTGKIGRSLLFRWIFDIDATGTYINFEIETTNEKQRSLLHVLAFSIANQTWNLYTSQTAGGFKFVHTNLQDTYINSTTISNLTSITAPITSNSPDLALNLQCINGTYTFISNSYIYLKISFDGSTSNLRDELINACSNQQTEYNQVYINSRYFNVGIGQDYTAIPDYMNNLILYKKDQSGLLAKIMVSTIAGNYDVVQSNIINNNSYYIHYDDVLNNVSQVSIQLYDPDFRLLEIPNDFNFTMEIHEIQDVLKETLINSKTNGVSSTGHFI